MNVAGLLAQALPSHPQNANSGLKNFTPVYFYKKTGGLYSYGDSSRF
jgi:hypothetical protein